MTKLMNGTDISIFFIGVCFHVGFLNATVPACEL